MQAEAETIRKMSETLESANFTRDQSDAFIQSMALAMKTFAVTPQVLDDRLDNLSGELRREWKQDLAGVSNLLQEHKNESNRRFDSLTKSLDEHKKDSNRNFDSLDARLGEHKNETNQRLDEIPKLRDSIDELKNSMHELQRSVMNYFLGFTLVILAGLLGALGFLLAS